MELPFKDRAEAGRRLAHALQCYAHRADVLVLALPRGGVPVAFPVAAALRAPLDIALVRKLGLPGQEELAMGAIASGGGKVLNKDLMERFMVPEAAFAAVEARERRELQRRERIYRGPRPAPDVRGRCLILVDDGMATGASMLAAVAALRSQEPACLVAAVPVAPAETLGRLAREGADTVCLATPCPFFGVGRWYLDFAQTPDEEVRRLLSSAWRAGATSSGPPPGHGLATDGPPP